MTGLWNPEVWNGIGVVALMVMTVLTLLVAIQRGWIVIGLHHREVVQNKDYTIAQLEARALKDADAIGTLSKAITDKNAAEAVTTKVLSALRDVVEGR